MGWKTYHQVVTELSPNEWVYSGMRSYVLTHKQKTSTDEVIFTDKSPQELLIDLKKNHGKDIWICGGASIVNQLIAQNLIDRYHLTIMPTLLGDGIRLFDKGHQDIKLKLMSTQSYNGMTDLVYERREVVEEV